MSYLARGPSLLGIDSKAIRAAADTIGRHAVTDLSEAAR